VASVDKAALEVSADSARPADSEVSELLSRDMVLARNVSSTPVDFVADPDPDSRPQTPGPRTCSLLLAVGRISLYAESGDAFRCGRKQEGRGRGGGR
jgi:hypothetical protein